MNAQTSASAYAERIINATPQTVDGILAEMIAAMMREASEIAEARHVATAVGWAGVIAEQNRKYRAVCNRVCAHFGAEGLMNLSGFVDVLREIYPEAYALALEGGFKP